MKPVVLVLLLVVAAFAHGEEGKEGKHLFILSGQSNMARLDPSVSFTPAVVEAFGKDSVIVVKDALGGKSIRLWYRKPEAGKDFEGTFVQYDSLMARLGPAMEDQRIATVTLVWMQGERDANRKEKDGGRDYAENLRGLIAKLGKDLGRDDLNVVIGRLNDHGMDNPEWQVVRKAQVAVAEAHPQGAWVDTDDLNGKKDTIHCTKAGYAKLGQRFAEKAIGLVRRQMGDDQGMPAPGTTEVPAGSATGAGEAATVAGKPLKTFVLAGQSNMVGRRATVEELPEELKAAQEDALFFDGEAWVSLAPGKTEKVGFGPEISFARRMARRLGEPVGVIKHSAGGTSLAVGWSPDNPDSLYGQLLGKVRRAGKARPLEIAGFVWVQGGADARSREHAEAYGENLRDLIAAARRDYRSPEMAVVCERIRPIPTKAKPYMLIVRRAHVECGAENYRWVDCDDVERGKDNTHYTTAGYVDLGYRCADAMLELLGVTEEGNERQASQRSIPVQTEGAVDLKGISAGAMR